MKKLFFGLVGISLLMACNSNSSNNSGTTASASDAPKMKFEKETHDFGKIKAGTTVSYDFKFTNTGKTPLIVSGAQASCGCTIPTWPHTPIKPGDAGVIAVTFNSTGKMGLQDKQIVVTANTVPTQNIVHMIGEVDVAK